MQIAVDDVNDREILLNDKCHGEECHGEKYEIPNTTISYDDTKSFANTDMTFLDKIDKRPKTPVEEHQQQQHFQTSVILPPWDNYSSVMQKKLSNGTVIYIGMDPQRGCNRAWKENIDSGWIEVNVLSVFDDEQQQQQQQQHQQQQFAHSSMNTAASRNNYHHQLQHQQYYNSSSSSLSENNRQYSRTMMMTAASNVPTVKRFLTPNVSSKPDLYNFDCRDGEDGSDNFYVKGTFDVKYPYWPSASIPHRVDYSLKLKDNGRHETSEERSERIKYEREVIVETKRNILRNNEWGKDDNVDVTKYPGWVGPVSVNRKRTSSDEADGGVAYQTRIKYEIAQMNSQKRRYEDIDYRRRKGIEVNNERLWDFPGTVEEFRRVPAFKDFPMSIFIKTQQLHESNDDYAYRVKHERKELANLKKEYIRRSVGMNDSMPENLWLWQMKEIEKVRSSTSSSSLDIKKKDSIENVIDNDDEEKKQMEIAVS